jgi:putative flippase GtrA
MKRHLYSARDLIIPIIDFFHPPFRRLMDIQTFRYAACGGSNVLLGLVIYAVTYKYILREENLHFGFYAFKPHVAALFISSVVNFLVGFLLMKYVVFVNSAVKGRVQLFRYFTVFLFNLMLNYVLLKVLVERLRISAILSQIVTTAIVILVAYLMQKHYTFKVAGNRPEVKD